jgi:hypothetical protein
MPSSILPTVRQPQAVARPLQIPRPITLSYPNPFLGDMATPLGSEPYRLGELDEDGQVRRSAQLRRDAAAQSPGRKAILMVWYVYPVDATVGDGILTCSSLLMGLFISCVDTSIVSTALIKLSDEFMDFSNAPWVVLAYLITYMGTPFIAYNLPF